MPQKKRTLSIELDSFKEVSSERLSSASVNEPALQEILRRSEVSAEQIQTFSQRYQQTIEFSVLRSELRWKSVDHMPQKFLAFAALPQGSFEGKGSFSSPGNSLRRHWIHGQAIPIQKEGALRTAFFIETFRRKTEMALLLPLHLGLPALTLYHAMQYFRPKYRCGRRMVENVSFGNFISTLRGSDKKSLAGILHTSVGNETAVGLFFALPFIWGIGNGLRQAFIEIPKSEETFLDRVSRLNHTAITFKTRWLSALPFHPLSEQLLSVQRQLLWNNTLSLETKEKAMEAIESYLNHGAFAQILALGAVAQLAYAAHSKDLAFLNNLGVLDNQHTAQWLSFKSRALAHLQKHKRLSRKEKKKWLIALYARYALWTLGLYESLFETTAWTAFKAAKLYTQIELTRLIISNFLEALRCPDPGGYTLAGPTNKAGRNTQKCLDAYIAQFGKIPGQQVTVITDSMKSFYLDTCSYTMDLSGKGLNSDQAGSLIQSFVQNQPLVALISLDLSGNALTDPSFYNQIFPLLTDLERLNLSNNGLGEKSSAATQALGQNLMFLTRLKYLDLSVNAIGHEDSLGTQAIGQSLPFLTKLQTLLAGHNRIERRDTHATVIIGSSFKYLTNLQTLSLENNFIGAWNSLGTQALGQGIHYLTNIQDLNLEGNQIGQHDPFGTQAIGQNLGGLTRLRKMNLSFNFIGYSGPNGTRALGHEIKKLSHLEQLDFMPQWYDVPLKTVSLLNHGLKETSAPLLELPLYTQEDLVNYLQTLPESETAINLGARLSFPVDPSESRSFGDALMNELKRFPHLTDLDLSRNYLGYSSSLGTQAIGEGLCFLTNLQDLNLGYNGLGYPDSLGTQIICHNLRFLTNLRVLSLRSNVLSRQNTLGLQALGDSLPFLTNLQSLSLAINDIGAWDSFGTQAIGYNLRFLVRLQTLDLARNRIGEHSSNGTLAIAESLPFLTNLQSLDLTLNRIGTHGMTGPNALIQGLAHLKKLQTLQISGTNFALPNNDFSALIDFYKQQIQKSCTEGRCFGKKSHTNFDVSNVPPYLPLMLQAEKQGEVHYAPGYEPDFSTAITQVESSPGTRLSGPFWLAPIKKIWPGRLLLRHVTREAHGAFISPLHQTLQTYAQDLVHHTSQQANSLLDQIVQRIANYSTHVVTSCPCYFSQVPITENRQGEGPEQNGSWDNWHQTTHNLEHQCASFYIASAPPTTFECMTPALPR